MRASYTASKGCQHLLITRSRDIKKARAHLRGLLTSSHGSGTSISKTLRIILLLASLLAVVYQLRVAFGFSPTSFRSAEVVGGKLLPDLYEASIDELQDGLDKGLFTSVDLVVVSDPHASDLRPLVQTHWVWIWPGVLCSYGRSQPSRSRLACHYRGES